MEKLLGLSELSIISWRLMLRIAIKWSFSVCVNFNSLHAKCTFICIRDLFSLRKVHIYMHGVTAKPSETLG